MDDLKTPDPIVVALPAERKQIVIGDDPPRDLLYVIQDQSFEHEQPLPIYDFSDKRGGPKPFFYDIQNVLKLLNAFRAHMTIEQACYSIGITRQSYYIFLKANPQFQYIKEHAENSLLADAKITVRKAIKDDPSLAFRVMQGMEPERYRRRDYGTQQDRVRIIEQLDESFVNADGTLAITDAFLLDDGDDTTEYAN